jgi:hypothetical protein
MILQRIEKALKDSISYHNEGMHPNDAITKSASENELNPETICRVVEAFNIAKTRAHIKNASVKYRDFDTADKAIIIRRVFGEAPVEHSQKQASGPDFKFEFKKVEREEFVKESFDFDLNEKIKEASIAREDIELELSNLKSEINFAKESFYNGLNKFAEYFSYSYNRETPESVFDAACFEYLENKIAMDVIDLISKTASLDYSIDENPVMLEYGDHPMHEVLDGMVYDAEDYAQKASKYNKEAKELNDSCRELEVLTRKIAGIDSGSGIDLLFKVAKGSIADKFAHIEEDLVKETSNALFGDPVAKETIEEKTASSFLKVAESGISVSPMGGLVDLGNIPLSRPLESAPGAKVKELEDIGQMLRVSGKEDSIDKDQVESEMQNIQRRAIVQDLIVNDEIISSYDPDITLTAYNTMVKLAPKASMMPDVVRSVLRYATAQTIDPHYASQLVELENNLNKQMSDGGSKK